MAGEGVMNKETFLTLAAALGLDIGDGHLDALYPEVLALLLRIEAVHDIDASEVPVEHAVSSFNGSGA